MKRVYAITLAISLILYSYNLSFLPSVSIAHFAFLLIMGYRLLQSHFKIDNTNFLLFWFVLFLVNLIDALIGLQTFDFSRSVIYLLLYLLWAVLLSPMFISMDFPVDYFYRLCVKIAIFTTIYLFVQTISFSVFRIRLPSTITGSILSVASDEQVINGMAYRARSVFSEPAYYSSFVLCILAPLLFGKIKFPHRRRVCALLTVGVLISSSTAGLIMLAVLYVMYTGDIIIKHKLSFPKYQLVLTLCVLAVLVVAIVNFDQIDNVFGPSGRAFVQSLEKLQTLETNHRTGGSFARIAELTGIRTILGCGIGNEYSFLGVTENNYINSFVRLILQTGLIGGLAFFALVVSLFRKYHDALSLYLIIFYLTKCFTGGALFSVVGIFTLSMLQIINTKSSVSSTQDIA